MPYILYKTNGTKLTTVEDAALDVSTSLTFVGKNYAGYGQIINQNLVKLLENFSNSSAPTKPVLGQLWFDSANQKLKVYSQSTFKSLSNIEVSATRPTNLTAGDFWFNSSTKKLWVKVDSSEGFILVGPTESSILGTRIEPAIIKDDAGNDKTVLECIANGTVVAVISSEPFTPESLTGFSIIKRGITLVNSDATTGVSSGGPTYLWGTAADSNRLGGVPASEYVLKTQNSTSTFYTQVKIVSDDGILIGSNQGAPLMQLYTDTGNSRAIIASRSSRIDFKVFKSSAVTNVLVLSSSSLYPPTAGGLNLGSVSLKFDTVYANKLSGALIDDTVVFDNGNITSTGSTEWRIASKSGVAKLKLYTDKADGLIELGTNAITVESNSIVTLTSSTVVANATGVRNIGYRDIPQFRTLVNVNVTLEANDRGGHLYASQSGISITVPPYASVPFPTGSAITVVNGSSGNITIAQGSGVTIQLAGGTTTGNRTLGAGGIVTLLKVDTNKWFAGGAGVT